MSPWWRRPTSDEDAKSEEPGDSAPSPEAAPDPPPDRSASEESAAEARQAEGSETSQEGRRGGDEQPAASRNRRSRSRRGRGGGGGAAAAAEEDEGPKVQSRRSGSKGPARVEDRRFEDSRFEDDSAGKAQASNASLETILRELFLEVPERLADDAEERKIALFCDFENIALGVRDSPIKKFDINLVLVRLLEKGKLVVKKAYSDWERYSEAKRTFHEAAIEMIDIPQKRYSGKNSADIKMVVDAMDLCYSKEHVDTFAILSGDSDFSPLVSKLKENNKYVIGVGVKDSSSSLLIDNCDEFLYYEDMWRDAQKAPRLESLEKKDSEVFGLMRDAILALVRENKDVLWGSMIKQTMKRKKPSFNEGYYGYSTFSELLEDGARKGIINLKKDKRSGSYIVTGFAGRR